MNMLLKRFRASVRQINKMICVPSKDRDQSVHLISLHCGYDETMSFSSNPTPNEHRIKFNLIGLDNDQAGRSLRRASSSFCCFVLHCLIIILSLSQMLFLTNILIMYYLL